MFTSEDMSDAFEAGFEEALSRVDGYAKNIAAKEGPTCRWFAENCQAFKANTPTKEPT